MAIDFVLAFPQADLNVNIWMYLPIGFQVDGQTEEDSNKYYILKLNKSLYGLKQASYDWHEKLKEGFENRGLKPSEINPCLYMKKGMIVMTYVDDCIIVSNSMKEIDVFVDSLIKGPEKFVLTDKGDIDKFLRIDINHINKTSLEYHNSFSLRE